MVAAAPILWSILILFSISDYKILLHLLKHLPMTVGSEGGPCPRILEAERVTFNDALVVDDEHTEVEG